MMKRKLINAAALILGLLLVFCIYIFYTSQRPLQRAEKEAIEVVGEKYTIQNVENFYWYNGSETYFTLAATDENNELYYAIVQQDGGQITQLFAKDIITESEAKSIALYDLEIDDDQLREARLGLLGGDAVWEVNYRQGQNEMGYYYLDATTGDWVKKITNI